MKRLLFHMLALCLLLAGCAPSKSPHGLDAARIQADTEYLCREIGDRPTGTEKESAACDWLEKQLTEMGFSSQTGSLARVPFPGLFELTSENLIATCNPGAEGPILCVMAHYDSVEGSPGARDNASSVAVLLELARYLGPAREDLQGEIRLLFLGSEENGYHGASAYVKGLSEAEQERHLAVFNMENSAASPGDGAILTCGTLGGIIICCIQLALSMMIRSFAIPIGISLVGGIGSLLATSQGPGLFYPYSLYSLDIRSDVVFFNTKSEQIIKRTVQHTVKLSFLCI